jgi:hypothetical protein
MRRLTAVLLAAFVLLPACAKVASPRSGDPSPTQGSGDRAAEVYTAIVRRLATTDNTFGEDYRFKTVYVLDHWEAFDIGFDREDEAAPPPDGSPSEATPATQASGERGPISAEARDRIATELADLNVVFVGSAEEVTESPQGCSQVKDGGAVITLGPLPDAGDRIEVRAGLFVACLAGTWLTYVVQHGGHGWTVEGTTGPVAIS